MKFSRKRTEILIGDRDGLILTPWPHPHLSLRWDHRSGTFILMYDPQKTYFDIREATFNYHPPIEDILKSMMDILPLAVAFVPSSDFIQWAKERGLDATKVVFQHRRSHVERGNLTSHGISLLVEDLLTFPQIKCRDRDDFDRTVDGVPLSEMTKDQLEQTAVCLDFWLARKS